MKDPKQVITVRQLSQTETNKLLADKVYRRFIPVKCNRCGEKSAFSRRIFHIMGVHKDEQNSDATQNMLSHYFYTQKKIEYTFFRGNKNKFYAESATCQKCKSTAVVFDIIFDDAMMAELSKIVGEEPKFIREKLDTLTKAFESQGAL